MNRYFLKNDTQMTNRNMNVHFHLLKWKYKTKQQLDSTLKKTWKQSLQECGEKDPSFILDGNAICFILSGKQYKDF